MNGVARRFRRQALTCFAGLWLVIVAGAALFVASPPWAVLIIAFVVSTAIVVPTFLLLRDAGPPTVDHERKRGG